MLLASIYKKLQKKKQLGIPYLLSNASFVNLTQLPWYVLIKFDRTNKKSTLTYFNTNLYYRSQTTGMASKVHSEQVLPSTLSFILVPSVKDLLHLCFSEDFCKTSLSLSLIMDLYSKCLFLLREKFAGLKYITKVYCNHN